MEASVSLAGKRRNRLDEFIAPFRVKPASKVRLHRDFDPAFKAGIKKKDGVKLLAEGVRLLSEYVKLFLNLSKEEQRKRFLRRIDLPDHNWKFSTADVREREYWDDYQHAFSEALTHTSTEWAPWHVIPADRKWFARLGAASVLVDALMEIDPRFPTIDKRRRQDLLDIRKGLEQQEGR